MALERKNLWAPWRIGYIKSTSDQTPEGCFICHTIDHPEQDKENLVLWRSGLSVILLNRFPYNNGHLLIAPKRHVGDLEDLDDDEMLDLMRCTREVKRCLAQAIQPHGYNIGVNLGRCAGAGLPDHLHIHIIPRWNGDTNFVSVCTDVEVISQSLDELLEQLKETAAEHGLGVDD